MRIRVLPSLGLLLAGAVFTAPLAAQDRVTTPDEQFGHEIGADYELINYQELHDLIETCKGEAGLHLNRRMGLLENNRKWRERTAGSEWTDWKGERRQSLLDRR